MREMRPAENGWKAKDSREDEEWRDMRKAGSNHPFEGLNNFCPQSRRTIRTRQQNELKS